MIPIHQQRQAVSGQGVGQFGDEIPLAGAAGKKLVDHRMRCRQHLQSVGGRKEHVVGPSIPHLCHEFLQLEGINGLLKRQRIAVPGNGLGRPMDADPIPAFCQPVGVGPSVAGGFSRNQWNCLHPQPGQCKTCEFSAIHDNALQPGF
jgi:hypothetical protein